ncbi:MAG: PEGA domain-containing protein [Blastocatellia bacterium]
MKRTLTHSSLQFLPGVLLLLIYSFAFAQTPPQAKLPEGTEVRLKLMQALSSATVQAGQTISLQVLDEIKINGVAVIAEGAPAWGTITEAEAKKSMGRGGKLALQIDYVKAVDGSKVPLRASSVAQGKGRGATVGVATAATAIAFWPAAPLFLLMKGKNVEVPRGQHISAFVDGDRLINVTPDAPATTADAPPQTGTARSAAMPATEFGAINVTSEPAGAEIEIDGVFYGNTPGLIRLPAGAHTITVRRTGHEVWKRNLNIGAGSNLTVSAELVKQSVSSARRAGSR